MLWVVLGVLAALVGPGGATPRVQALLAALLAALALAGDSAAKSFALPAADVVVQVGSDGSLIVDEVIAFDFDGGFSGAFREIPLRDGETIDQVAVSEEDVTYRPGASAVLGSIGEPGTFGMTETDKGVRIVWHYRALSEQRSFRVHYRLRGVAVAYEGTSSTSTSRSGATSGRSG